jgi:hypothetical protein
MMKDDAGSLLLSVAKIEWPELSSGQLMTISGNDVEPLNGMVTNSDKILREPPNYRRLQIAEKGPNRAGCPTYSDGTRRYGHTAVGTMEEVNSGQP